MTKQTCPRRMQEWGPWEYKEELDEWRVEPNGDRTCSFCGSLHPEDFEKVCQQVLADDTTWIEQSDKPYKVYIHRKGIHNASEGAIKYYKPHNYTDEAAIARMVPLFERAIHSSWPKYQRLFRKGLPDDDI